MKHENWIGPMKLQAWEKVVTKIAMKISFEHFTTTLNWNPDVVEVLKGLASSPYESAPCRLPHNASIVTQSPSSCLDAKLSAYFKEQFEDGDEEPLFLRRSYERVVSQRQLHHERKRAMVKKFTRPSFSPSAHEGVVHQLFMGKFCERDQQVMQQCLRSLGGMREDGDVDIDCTDTEQIEKFLEREKMEKLLKSNPNATNEKNAGWLSEVYEAVPVSMHNPEVRMNAEQLERAKKAAAEAAEPDWLRQMKSEMQAH